MFIQKQLFVLESQKLIKLALPILFAQLALTGLGVVDTIMSGRVGTDDLAAVGLGTNIMLPIFMFATGVLLAITPMISKANGQADNQQVAHIFVQGLWLSLPLGLLSLLALMNLNWLLDLLSLSSSVYQLTEEYLYYIAFGMPAVAAYQALRFFWEGLGKTLPTMWISFLALLLNMPLNALFIYGYGPVEGMGAAGCGVASAIVMWLMLLIGIVYILKNQILNTHFQAIFKVRMTWSKGIKPLMQLGLPNSFALLFEVSLFSFIILFIAPLGTTVIGSHQIAVNVTSLSFMIPLSLAMALTVRVGFGFGESSISNIQTTLFTGFFWTIVIGVIMAFVIYFLRFEIVSIYTLDKEVLYIATTLLVFAAIYQVSDAIQVNAAGALRGFHDTKVTMVVNFVSYWLIGLGLGYVLTFKDWIVEPMGVSGFWVGIVIGLTLAAILLPLRLRTVYCRVFHAA